MGGSGAGGEPGGRRAARCGCWEDNPAATAKGRPGSDEIVLKEYDINVTYGDMVARLLGTLMNALGCQSVLTSGGLSVVGQLADVERGDVLYTSLVLQMHSGAVRQEAR